MTLPTTSQIDRAIPPLRQAYELAVKIEGMDSFAPDDHVDKHKRQFQFQFEQVAMRLGYRIEHVSGPVLAVDNQPVTFGR